MIKRAIYRFVVVVLFPGILSFFMYYGFCTNYTGGLFHEAGFRQQYENGIYKYRVPGRILVLKTDQWLRSDCPVAKAIRGKLGHLPKSIPALDPEADPIFYAAYVIQNTFFLILCSWMLYAILSARGLRSPRSDSQFSESMGLMAGVLLIAITQFVVVPYGNLSFFLNLLAILLIVRPFKFSFPLFLVILSISTFAHETAALTLSFYLAYHFGQLLSLHKKELKEFLLAVFTFIATYVLVRVCLGWDHAFYQSSWLRDNLTTPFALMGIVFLPAVSYLICFGSANKRGCVVFLLASMPYIIGMIWIASTCEIRYWVPIWLSLLILARIVPSEQISQAKNGRGLNVHSK